MNLLFLTLLDFSTLCEHNIYTDLLREFSKNGHNVYAVSPTEKRNKQETHLIREDNGTILKLQIGNVQKTNIVEKGFSTLTLESKFVVGIKRYFENIKFDFALYSTPPITLQKAVAYVKKRDNVKTYLLLKDIFPQNAVDIDLMSTCGLNGFIYNYFRKKETKLYAISDYIGCMSQANVDYLLSHNPEVDQKKVEVCPNSIDPSEIIRDEDSVKAIRKKYGVPSDKTIFVYGGNLGKPQGIDFLIECLRKLVNIKDAFFLIVGSGTEYEKIRRFFDTCNPSNGKLFSQFSGKDYETLVSSCDVGLIFLDQRFTIPNFPSRLLTYMEYSLPVLAATDKNTDIRDVIEKNQFGYWCESGNLDSFTHFVDILCENRDLRIKMGSNARMTLLNKYTVQKSYEIIMNQYKNGVVCHV